MRLVGARVSAGRSSTVDETIREEDMMLPEETSKSADDPAEQSVLDEAQSGQPMMEVTVEQIFCIMVGGKECDR